MLMSEVRMGGATIFAQMMFDLHLNGSRKKHHKYYGKLVSANFVFELKQLHRLDGNY